MADPTYTAAPEAPSRARPTTFSGLMDAFLSWMVVFRNEMADTVPWFRARFDEIDGMRDDAWNAAGASESSAQNAADYAAAAAAAVGVLDVWQSGTSYAQHDAVISPLDNNTYRARVAITGSTTDPSNDLTRWAQLTGGGTMAYRDATISTNEPSGGSNGDVWFQVES